MKSNNKKRQSANNKSKQSPNKKSSNVLKFTSKAMPYILTVIAVVLLFSFIGLLGNTGKFIKDIFGGLFSNFASYFIPFFMFYHAIMWFYDVKRKICLRRVICSFIALFGMSTLQHIITLISNEELSKTNYVVDLYNSGVNGQGGGVIGGLISNGLTSVCGRIVSIAILFIVLTLMLLQMFNITPLSMLKSLFNKNDKPTKNNTQTPIPPQKRKVKRKKVDIFDDEEEGDTCTINTLTLTDSIVVDVKESEEKNDDSQKNINVYVSDQLEPYDENKDYGNENETNVESTTKNNNDDLVVSKTKITTDEESKEEVQKPEEIIEEKENKAFKVDVQNEDDKEIFQSNENNAFEELNEKDEVIEDFEEVNYDEFDKNESFEEIEDDAKENIEEVSVDVEYDIEDLVDTSEYEIIKNNEKITSQTVEIEMKEIDEDTNEISNEDASEILNNDLIEDSDEETTSNFEETQPNKTKDNLTSALSDKAYEMIYGKEKNASTNNSATLVTNEIKEVEKVTNPEQPKIKTTHKFPSLDFLNSKSSEENMVEIREELEENAEKIVTTLDNFSVKVKVVNISRGPTVTRYEIAPDKGVRVKAISSLSEDIALNLAAEGIRIESPIPGKSAIGIEIPNKKTSIVYLKDLLSTEKFQNAKAVLTCAVGKSISGDDIFMDIEKTPHLLVAGATGMGKSVCINSLLISMLYKASPEDLRLILVDPKRVELSNYNGIPHLLVPVVCEPKQSLGALQWAVTEMEKRFETIEAAGVRNLTEFNAKIDRGYQAEKMSRIVIVIDELADLKMAVPDIEGHITRLTQKARAAGIHVIIGTQRPSVDVITGLIKNNIPSRIAFRVPSQTDSRTILDEQGADKLVSRGDMLVKSVETLKPIRVQGAYVSAEEIETVINFLKENSEANYDEDVMQQINTNAAKLSKAEKKDYDDENSDGEELDSEFYNALRLAAEDGKISSSQLQRRLRLGFQRAARIIDQMYDLGFIGEPNGQKPRDVLITLEQYNEMMMRRRDNN